MNAHVSVQNILKTVGCGAADEARNNKSFSASIKNACNQRVLLHVAELFFSVEISVLLWCIVMS